MKFKFGWLELLKLHNENIKIEMFSSDTFYRIDATCLNLDWKVLHLRFII